MKKKSKNDNVLKKFITLTVVLLCLFGLCAGAVTAMGNTDRQLKNINNETVTENEIVDFFENVAQQFKNIKIVY